MIRTYDCPNCGASSHDEVAGDSVRCRYCGTLVVLPPAPSSREELEIERGQILARLGEWDARVGRAERRGTADFVVPPLGCCGLYAGIFMVGSLLFAATYRNIVAATAIGAALVGLVLIVWRREMSRRARLAALERERDGDRARAEERLREIEAELSRT